MCARTCAKKCFCSSICICTWYASASETASYGVASQVCNDPAGVRGDGSTEIMHAAVQQLAQQTISAMPGAIGGSGGGRRQGRGRKLNMLMSGRSMIVDVATGLGIEELGKELVSIAREGINLNRVSQL